MTPTSTPPDTAGSSKAQGALLGLYIGDALAMPVHWYYDRRALVRDYGRVVDFLPPRNPHPDSILWRSEYHPINQKGEILHDQAVYWGRRNIHYHQFLRAGENTLNIKIAGLLMDLLMENGRYRPDDFLRRYVAFMTTAGSHRDTYVEECHRHFFLNFARGVSPDQCGVEEKHIGGLPGIVPLVVFYRNRPRRAREAALEHLVLTHRGKKMEMAATLVIDLLLAVMGGVTLQDSIRSAIGGQANPLVGHPFSRWLEKPDEAVIGRHLSTACYVEDAVPAVLYLALKYHDDPEAAIIANANLGGDNAGRGAVLGALMGAAHAVAGFPARWVENLVDVPPELGAVRPGHAPVDPVD